MARLTLHQNANLHFGHVKINFILVRKFLSNYLLLLRISALGKKIQSLWSAYFSLSLFTGFESNVWPSSVFILKHSSCRKLKRMLLEKNLNELEIWMECLPKKNDWTTPTQFKQYLRRDIITVCKNYKVVNVSGEE